MTKEINEAGKELVVDSIRILKGDGFNGAGAATIERRINQVEQSVQVLSGRQNDFWSEIGKDNVITPIEKQTLYKEREVIRTEYASITKRAEDMGITGNLVYQKYDSAYNLLNNMLTNYGVFDDMSDSTTIPNRELFNLSYSEYYDMRDALQDAITKGYVSEGQGTLDRDAVPSMKLSAYAVRVNDSLTVYDPPRIEITGVITNGTYEDPYNSIFEIYRNGSETPSVRTGILKTLSYDIPQGTVDLRIVQRNVEGRLIYDDEVIHILNAESGSKMVLDNAYQTFINGTKTKADTEQTDLKTVVKAYSNGYERPVENVTVSEAPSLQVILDDNNTIHMVPTDEVLESGEIEVSATMRDPQVVGFGGFVLGDPNTGFVIGQIIREPVEEKIEYKNYDTLAFQELESKQLEDATKGKYLGPVSQPQTLQNVEYGQYFLYTGDDTAYWQKGTLYLWNGKRWVLDFNNEHNTVAMKDMFSLLDSMPALANEFIHNLVSSTAFIKQLFSEFITVQDGGHIKSANYDGHFNEETGVIDNPGNTGWAIDSLGNSDFVNLHATNSSFEGDIYTRNAVITGTSRFEGEIISGPLELLNEQSPGRSLTVSPTNGRQYPVDIARALNENSFFKSYTYSNPFNYSGTTYKLKGSFNGYTFSYVSFSTSGNDRQSTETLRLYNENNQVIKTYSGTAGKDIGSYYINTTSNFTVELIVTGSKTFKLIGLPKEPPATGSNVVWNDNGTLKIAN